MTQTKTKHIYIFKAQLASSIFTIMTKTKTNHILRSPTHQNHFDWYDTAHMQLVAMWDRRLLLWGCYEDHNWPLLQSNPIETWKFLIATIIVQECETIIVYYTVIQTHWKFLIVEWWWWSQAEKMKSWKDLVKQMIGVPVPPALCEKVCQNKWWSASERWES